MSISSNTKKIVGERTKVFTLIDSAFSTVHPPSGWEGYFDVKDFERELGEDFITGYWRDVYDSDVRITQYVLPFIMKHFASAEEWSIEDAVNVELFIMQLTPAVQHEIGFGDFYETMYNQYSLEQKKAVCGWLKFMKGHANGALISGIDDAISYWCKS